MWIPDQNKKKPVQREVSRSYRIITNKGNDLKKELPSLKKPPEDPYWNLTAKTNQDNLKKMLTTLVSEARFMYLYPSELLPLGVVEFQHLPRGSRCD